MVGVPMIVDGSHDWECPKRTHTGRDLGAFQTWYHMMSGYVVTMWLLTVINDLVLHIGSNVSVSEVLIDSTSCVLHWRQSDRKSWLCPWYSLLLIISTCIMDWDNGYAFPIKILYWNCGQSDKEWTVWWWPLLIRKNHDLRPTEIHSVTNNCGLATSYFLTYNSENIHMIPITKPDPMSRRKMHDSHLTWNRIIIPEKRGKNWGFWNLKILRFQITHQCCAGVARGRNTNLTRDCISLSPLSS